MTCLKWKRYLDSVVIWVSYRWRSASDINSRVTLLLLSPSCVNRVSHYPPCFSTLLLSCARPMPRPVHKRGTTNVTSQRPIPVPFVTIATLGNVISLCGSCFLMGPTSQSKKMFHPSRRIATILYLSSLILTLVVAFALLGWKGQSLLLVVLMICQYVAIAWYCMSYVPFARQLATRLCSRLCSEVIDMD